MYTPESNDIKDSSKNLMSGDFERQYKEGMEKSGSRRKGCVIFGVTVGALALWLLVLTIVREVQINKLRYEVDQLTANMIAMTANVKSLNQKLTNNRLFNEFKNLEDTLYADEDQDVNLVEEDKETKQDKQSYDSLEKLHGLTVLEGDDEDMFEGDDDAESGDWYPDYDRREKIGSTNMVRLTPDDFMEGVVGVDVGGNLNEIKRLLNENPEIQDIALPTLPSFTRNKVEVTSKTPDTEPEKQNGRVKRRVMPDSAADAITPVNTPKAFAKLDERRKTKKYIPQTEAITPSLHTVSRTVRDSAGEEDGQRRPFIAAHFHGNTSHLNTEIHEHFKGNGLVRVSHGAPHDVWYPAPWTAASPHPRPTLTRSGHVHVHHTGVYLVYVQIYYLDSHDIISWVLHRTNPYTEGRDTLLQCAQTSHSNEPTDRPNSCFSASALFLRAGDRLAVRNTGGDRHSLMQPEKSFIGLVKLADADEPIQEL
ncbi:protein eiger [Colias croceus]|uniref:protein eiger n=1 Tax=Colias crocea TaxID=72248 RepID=UPI001E280F5C|nr:protein eiger [Colias croceus]